MNDADGNGNKYGKKISNYDIRVHASVWLLYYLFACWHKIYTYMFGKVYLKNLKKKFQTYSLSTQIVVIST